MARIHHPKILSAPRVDINHDDYCVASQFELASLGLFRVPRSVMTSCSRRSSSDGSDHTFGDADVRIGDVKTMLFNVF